MLRLPARARPLFVALTAAPALLALFLLVSFHTDPALSGLARAPAGTGRSPCLRRSLDQAPPVVHGLSVEGAGEGDVEVEGVSGKGDEENDGDGDGDGDGDAGITMHLQLPSHINKLHVDIGPNATPLLPPPDEPDTGTLAVEPDARAAHALRERYDRRALPGRFFTLGAAVSGGRQAGGVASVRQSPTTTSTATATGTGKGSSSAKDSGFGFVPVISLARLLRAVPPAVAVPQLRVRAGVHGAGLVVIRSAPVRVLRRVRRVRAAVLLGEAAAARAVLGDGGGENLTDWTAYMRPAGYELESEPPGVGPAGWRAWDAVWVRQD